MHIAYSSFHSLTNLIIAPRCIIFTDVNTEVELCETVRLENNGEFALIVNVISESKFLCLKKNELVARESTKNKSMSHAISHALVLKMRPREQCLFDVCLVRDQFLLSGFRNVSDFIHIRYGSAHTTIEIEVHWSRRELDKMWPLHEERSNQPVSPYRRVSPQLRQASTTSPLVSLLESVDTVLWSDPLKGFGLPAASSTLASSGEAECPLVYSDEETLEQPEIMSPEEKESQLHDAPDENALHGLSDCGASSEMHNVSIDVFKIDGRYYNSRGEEVYLETLDESLPLKISN